ncbi:FK506-binding protein 5 isoform X2 [Coccinella septempunctata]|uniref:FK506-binding protein 5 isoform X2 n=1 Tax=Coccinella septempunctata TaxID=41139 RepID=UPI001D06CA5B|nr:FK506-binding protein 5 isoform X2 [Coccinella septempunctata]
MDEHGMENEHSEFRISSNTEYLPTKCRVTKPPPPKPATNPLQFIKVAPPPLFQKAKEQIQKVEKIKKERREVQDETEDWQANLDNWKSSRRKLQEHIIERVVEVKKFEQEDNGRSRRRSKTFNEILEERGKSKYSIPIYLDEANDWSDLGISDSRSDRSQDSGSSERNTLTVDQYSSDDSSSRKDSSAEYISNASKSDVAYNNNNNHQPTSNKQLDSKDAQDNNNASKIGQYTYEGAIEGYRSRIKSRIDDTILNRISEMPRRTSEVISVVPKGEIVKRKELFDRPQTADDQNVPKTTARVLQEFENSVSIKQRLKSLEKCSDQTVKYVDNINIKPKVKQISQLFDKPCTETIRNDFNNDIPMNNNQEYTERREKININIVPWRERMSSSETSDIFLYSDKNDLKEVESQSDDKSSDTFYSGLEDNNYPPSVSSTDYMALSSDREDSGIHTADVSCSVSQADDTAEEVESNTNSHETVNDDFHPRQKYYKDMEDNNNIYDDHVLKLTEENVNNQSNIDLLDGTNSQYEPSTISSISKDSVFSSPDPQSRRIEESTLGDVDSINLSSNETDEHSEKEVPIINETSQVLLELPEVKNEIPKIIDITPAENQRLDNIDYLNIVDTLTSPMGNEEFVFDPNFPLLPTKMVEPPKVKPPPPPVLDDEKPQDLNIKRMNSTKRIKKEITLKRSSFLGLNEPSDAERDPLEGISIAVSEREQSKVEEILAKQLYESKISDYVGAESQNSGLDIDNSVISKSSNEALDKSVEILATSSSKKSPVEEDEITKREREIIEMVEKAEKFRVTDVKPEEKAPEKVQKPPIPLTRTVPSTMYVQKPADASYYDKKPDYLDDQDSEVLKVEKELQQLEQEELKRKRDNLLFRQNCSRVFAKNKRYSLENIFDSPSSALECRKSMPELQCLKVEKEHPNKPSDLFRSIHDVDLKFRKSVPNLPGYLYNHAIRNDFQTIEKYEKTSMPKFQHDVHRSAFEVPARKPILPYPTGGLQHHTTNKFLQQGEQSACHHKPQMFTPSNGELPPLKTHNRNVVGNAWPKPRHNVETRSYDQHWLYQEAELRRLQDQKNYNNWHYKQIADPSVPNLINRGPIPPSHASSKSSIRKLTSVNNEIQPYMELQNIGPSLPVTQPRSMASEEGTNRILSVSGKKKCSFCGNELGRGAAMIIETLCLFYHMECFKCCVCHVQLGNGLNGTDVRVRNQKLHCHNCYSSDDGVKFSCV